MDIIEFRDELAKSPYKEEITEKKFVIFYSLHSQKDEFSGLVELFDYAKTELMAWEKELDVPKELKPSKLFFIGLVNKLDHFITGKAHQARPMFDQGIKELSEYLKSAFPRDNRQRLSNQAVMKCRWPETIFLIGLHKEGVHSISQMAAFDYLNGNLNSNPAYISKKPYFEGLLLAYDFKKSIGRKEADFDLGSSLKSTLDQIDQFFKESSEVFSALHKQVRDQQDDLLEEINEHFRDVKKTNSREQESFQKNASQITDTAEAKIQDFEKRMEALEELYGEKLKLQKPAQYWQDRGKEYRRRGLYATVALIGFIVIIPVGLGMFLLLSPSEILSSFFEVNKAPAIRWTLFFLTILTLAIFGIRFLSKFAVSSYHLARDAEERKTLSYLYLALLEDSTVEKEDRKLVLQALFSRADTGLLKSDSSPTLPNDFIDLLKRGG